MSTSDPQRSWEIESANSRLVLASASPRRLELLNQVRIACRVEPASCELAPSNAPPEENAESIAVAKAQDVAGRYEGSDIVVLAADTLVHLNGEIIGKPRDRVDSARILALLRGRCHDVVTGYAIICTASGETVSGHSSARVRVRDLSDQEIDRYVATGEGDDKAGAYAIQGRGALLVESINGDYYAVVGLPLGQVVGDLRRLGIDSL